MKLLRAPRLLVVAVVPRVVTAGQSGDVISCRDDGFCLSVTETGCRSAHGSCSIDGLKYFSTESGD